MEAKDVNGNVLDLNVTCSAVSLQVWEPLAGTFMYELARLGFICLTVSQNTRNITYDYYLMTFITRVSLGFIFFL